MIVPGDFATDPRFEKVGDLVRVEAEKLVVGYSFDLRTNDLTSETIPNSSAGKEHHFTAYRLKDQGGEPVSMTMTAIHKDAP